MLFVLITGARFYQNIAVVMEQQFKERTCLSYVVANVRHHDEAGSVSVREYNGIDVLIMRESSGSDGDANDTMIYFYDGYIYELYAPMGSQFDLGDGFRLIQIDDMKFEELTPSLFRVECSFAGRTDQLLFHVSSR